MARAKIFDRNDYNKLIEAERQIADLIPVVDDLEACDFDCTEYRTLLGQAQERLSKIREKFMTPPPKR